MKVYVDVSWFLLFLERHVKHFLWSCYVTHTVLRTL